MMLMKLTPADLGTISNEVLGTKIENFEQLERSHRVRVANALKAQEIITVEDLLKYEHKLKLIPNMGTKYIRELEEALTKLLGYDVIFQE